MRRLLTDRERELLKIMEPYMVNLELVPDAPEEAKRALEELRAMDTPDY